jgi:hypothetical protein
MQMKLFCTAIVLSLVSSSAITSPFQTREDLPVQNNFSDSLSSSVVKKINVRLSPNPTTNGTIRINSNINEPLHFYVFDFEGTLLYRIALSGKAEKKITNLMKGTYLYDVFKNDESIEQGKIIAK